VHRNLAVSAASPAAATQFGSVPGFSPSAQSQRPAAAGLSRDGSNKATIAAFLAQQARSFEISLLRARNQEKIPDHRLENRDTDGGRKEAQFPVVRQAMEKDIMIKDFNVSEKGHGSYWLLGILRWVMVLIFVSFGIQKFTPQSADGIALYISNSPFVSWLSIFGIRGEAYLLGIIELTTAALLAAGAFIPILSALGSLMGLGTFAITWSFFFSTPGVVKRSRSSSHWGAGVPGRRTLSSGPGCNTHKISQHIVGRRAYGPSARHERRPQPPVGQRTTLLEPYRPKVDDGARGGGITTRHSPSHAGL
jgi:uncharacterized membrane protein YkgB